MPLEEMAIIKTSNDFTNIVRIDGKPTTKFLNFMIAGEFPNNIPVSPGKHVIAVSYWDKQTKGWAAYEIQTLPGKTYLAKSEKLYNSVSIWFEDEEAGSANGKLLEIQNEPFPVSAKPLTQAQLFNFIHPGDTNWVVEHRNSQEISLIRQGDKLDETFGLTILPYSIESFDNGEEFLEILKTMRNSNHSDSDRFKVVKNNLSLIEISGLICAEAQLIVEDNNPVKRTDTPGNMLLEIDSYECQHPHNKNIAVSFAYSHRHYPDNKTSKSPEILKRYFEFLKFK